MLKGRARRHNLPPGSTPARYRYRLEKGKEDEFTPGYGAVRAVISPVFFVLLVSLTLFFVVNRLLQPTGIYDFVWHPALFNSALFCCLFYLLFRYGL